MSWNYRIVAYANGQGYGLHRVHYDANGKEIKMGERPAWFAADTPGEVVTGLVMAKRDAIRHPIFDEPIEWNTEPEA